MTSEHSQLIAEEAHPAEVRTGEELLPGEVAAALELWFHGWREGAARSTANVDQLAKVLGVTEARARELVQEVRSRRVRSEVEAVAAAVYRNRRRNPTLVWALVAVAVVLLLTVVMFGAVRTRSVSVTHAQEGPALPLEPNAPTTAPEPAGSVPR